MTASLSNQVFKPFRLGVSQREAVDLLRSQIAEGVTLGRSRISSAEALAAAREAKAQWNYRTCTVLLRIDPSEQLTELFNRPVGDFVAEDAEFKFFVARFYDEVKQRIRRLQAILAHVQQGAIEPAEKQSGQVESSSEADIVPPPAITIAPPAPAGNADVHPSENTMSNDSKTQSSRHTTALVMHASNPVAEKSITEFLTRLGYESVLLGNGSDIRSAMETLSRQPASFAVFLATPEEIAAAHDGQTTPAPVCRDMIFELGYFVGKLGDGRTCVVHTGNETPFQDKFGIPYIPLDDLQGWQLQVARHLKRSGIELDLNRLC